MLTKKQIAEKVEEIRAVIRAEIDPFPNDTPEKQLGRKQRVRSGDFDYFCQTYLPNFFSSPAGDFHRETDTDILKNSGEIIAFCGPREHGKTVRWGIAFELFAIITRSRRFIVNVSETADLAIVNNLNVRTHLESNTRLQHDFGNLANHASWAEDNFVTKNNVKVLARGYKQPVRGLLFGSYRPDYINIQDLTSLQSSRNAQLEREKMDWVLGECFGALGSEGKTEKGMVFWAGNYMRKASAIAQCEKEANKPERTIIYKRLAACNFATGWVLWPERFDIEYFQSKRRKVGSRVFEREWQQEDSEGGIYYSEGQFNKFSLEDSPQLWKVMRKRIIYIDPAFGRKKQSSQNRGSDLNVAVVMGENEQGYFLFWTLAGQLSPTVFADRVCGLFIDWHPEIVWYEANFHQETVVGDNLERAADGRGIHLPYKPYYARNSKLDRIEYPTTFAEQGKLWYCDAVAENQNVIDDLCMHDGTLTGGTFQDRKDVYGTGIEVLEKGSSKVKIKILGARR